MRVHHRRSVWRWRNVCLARDFNLARWIADHYLCPVRKRVLASIIEGLYWGVLDHCSRYDVRRLQDCDLSGKPWFWVFSLCRFQRYSQILWLRIERCDYVRVAFSGNLRFSEGWHISVMQVCIWGSIWERILVDLESWCILINVYFISVFATLFVDRNHLFNSCSRLAEEFTVFFCDSVIDLFLSVIIAGKMQVLIWAKAGQSSVHSWHSSLRIRLLLAACHLYIVKINVVIRCFKLGFRLVSKEVMLTVTGCWFLLLSVKLAWVCVIQKRLGFFGHQFINHDWVLRVENCAQLWLALVCLHVERLSVRLWLQLPVFLSESIFLIVGLANPFTGFQRRNHGCFLNLFLVFFNWWVSAVRLC